MIITSNCRSRNAATVRLMPSTRDRPFRDQQRRQAQAEIAIVSQCASPSRRTSSIVPSRVDVALDEVTAERGVGPHRSLEIHRLIRPQRAERRHARRLGADVRVQLAALDAGHRQTDAVDGHALAERQLRRERGANADAESGRHGREYR